jgi:Fur family ferric uptake transcriptional regulator
MDWVEHAEGRLAGAGHRSGGARREVVQLLSRQKCCLSAQQIHDQLRGRAGLASVYRALEALDALGLVHRVDVDGVACFEPADPGGHHHHHAICDDCGRMDVFADEELEKLIHGVADRLGYSIGAHDIVVRGACPACRT